MIGNPGPVAIDGVCSLCVVGIHRETASTYPFLVFAAINLST